MYFKDFSSGAMIENIVRRAKKLAIKREHRRRRPRASGPRTSSSRSTRSTRSTRTCPTPPTPTTGRRSRARRASGSSTCAPWSTTRTTAGRRRRPGHRAGRHRPVPRRAGRLPVAIPKICGIETEYGIVVRGAAESNPVSASSMLINAYLSDLDAARRAGPAGRLGLRGRVARQRRPGRGPAPRSLRARGRDAPRQRGAHQRRPLLRRPRPPRVLHARVRRRPRASCVYDQAGERILPRSMDGGPAAAARGPGDRRLQEQLRRQGQQLRLPRELPGRPRGAVRTHRAPTPPPHFVTRQVFTGAGKVGSEAPGMRTDDVPFQLSQRADFFEEEVGLETTLKRPIVNTRDEPHADAAEVPPPPRDRRRRQPVRGRRRSSRSAPPRSCSPMIEDDALATRDLRSPVPVPAMRQVSYDLTLRRAARAGRRHAR